MDLKLNSEAYEVFVKIEVGLREFMIHLIKGKGVSEWTQSFLGKTHLDSIKEIGKRIQESIENNRDVAIEDVYVSKVSKEYKNKIEGFRRDLLFHPFYYLNWSDFIGVLNKNPNTELLEQTVGKLNRELLITNLKALNYLRNDIAHSRIISDENLTFIQRAYDQISICIPQFQNFFLEQSKEQTTASIKSQLNYFLLEIINADMLANDKLAEIQTLCSAAINSFWMNQFYIPLIEKAKMLNNQLALYQKYRNTPGGLLSINNWKIQNQELLLNLKQLTND